MPKAEPTTQTCSVAVSAAPPATQIDAAICSVLTDMPFVFRDAHNSYSDYNYASVDQVYNSLRELIARKGLYITQSELSADIIQTTKGSGLLIRYEFYICHVSGEAIGPYVRSGTTANLGSTEMGKVQSYTHKMFMRGFFMMATGDPDMDDGASKAIEGRAHILRDATASAKTADEIIGRVNKAGTVGEVDSVAAENAGAYRDTLTAEDRERVQVATLQRRQALTANDNSTGEKTHG